MKRPFNLRSQEPGSTSVATAGETVFLAKLRMPRPEATWEKGFQLWQLKKKQFHSCFEKNTMRHITRSCFQSKPARDHRHSPIFHWIALSHPPTPGLSSPLQAIKNARAGLNVRYQMCDFTQIFYIARSVLAILSLNIESPNNGIPLVI